MHKIWFERKRMIGHGAVFAGVAEPIGPGTEAEPLRGIEAANGIIAGGVEYTAAVMDKAPNLKVIARTGIGVDTVDVTAATARGIAVVNTPDAPSVPTAEQTMMLLLAVAKQLKQSELRLRAGEGNFHARHNALELAGKTLGLAGFGRIARLVARMAQGFAMTVVTFDPYVPAEVLEGTGVERAPSFDKLLARSDIVSLHTPLLPETRHLMNAAAFAKMKRGSLFINAGRGGLVDEAALLAVVTSGHLFGAGLDVTDPEPARPDNPLLHLENVVVTPHVASATPEGKTRMFVGALEQVVQVLKGERPPHLVNPEVWRG
ncbi:hypothetical protein BH24DEI2_BH24DEI2_17230 [soil metagenome]